MGRCRGYGASPRTCVQADQDKSGDVAQHVAPGSDRLALLLATIGLYGVTAYTVARRTSEIGIRMALGARRRGVVAMVMRGAMSQTAIGLAIGVPAALLSVRFMESQLFEIKGVNVAVLLIAILALAVASLLAGMIPATGAASTEPARTLRAE